MAGAKVRVAAAKPSCKSQKGDETSGHRKDPLPRAAQPLGRTVGLMPAWGTVTVPRLEGWALAGVARGEGSKKRRRKHEACSGMDSTRQ